MSYLCHTYIYGSIYNITLININNASTQLTPHMYLKKYIIHHTPYTIYHTPYTIHHTPYTIHHIPYTIYHIPYTIYHI
ncbi:hypothetical protein EON63_09100, partial [archaeon]